MITRNILILSALFLVICANTILLTRKILSNLSNLNINSILMPIAGFHTVAFIVSFLHWTFDTWTVKDVKLRNRTFNQAKTHHYYPTLVVKKDFFARNDDAIYSSFFFCILFMLTYNYVLMNTNIYIYSLILSASVSLEIHRYAHINPKKVPYLIRQLQKTGIILSKESHSKHHNGEFYQSYDLMSGIMNNIVDYIGIYPILEKFVTRLSGLKPRTYLNDEVEREELHEYHRNHKL